MASDCSLTVAIFQFLIRVGLQELNLSKTLELCWEPPCLYLLLSYVGYSRSSSEKLGGCEQLRSKLGIGLSENQVFCFILSPASPRKFSVVSSSCVQHCL